MARSLGALFAAGATLALVTVLLFPLPEGTDVPANLAIVAIGYLGAAVMLGWSERLPSWSFHLLLALGTLLATGGIYFSGETATDNQLFYLWVTLYAYYFFDRALAAVQMAIVGTAYGVVLSLQPAQSPPVTRWLITMGTLVVAGELIAALRRRTARGILYDQLTRLPNRALFLRRLEQALMPSSRRERRNAQKRLEERRSAVLLVDIDRFKVVNDSLGHHCGDRMLAEVGHRLESCVRPGDTVARFGGDQFTVFLEAIEDESQATGVSKRIEEELEAPILLEGRELFVTASMGIALTGPERMRPEDLVRDADAAMHRAKQAGKGQLQVFDESMSAHALERLELENDLRRAIVQDEFEVFYQPKIRLRDFQPIGAEALVRWRHEKRGLVPPSHFIGCAEDTGMILPIGRRVLEQACQEAHSWDEGDSSLLICVNLSARQFQHPDLVSEVAQVLDETGLQPRRLELEITEGLVMHDEPSTVETLHGLKRLGVGIAIDDFGTGYSSFNRLRQLPVDVLKIDRSLVAELGDGPRSRAIVGAIISLGRTLGLLVVSEGIETETQLEELRRLGCHVGQGYYFAHPAAPHASRALLTGAAPA